MRSGLSHRRAIIVGGGQSGLSVAAALIDEGMRPQQDFVVIDAAPEGQRSWATRWHSMELLSDARHSSLPRRRLPGDQRRHVRADEVADYLADFEAGLGVETIWGVRALAVDRRGDGSTLHLQVSEGEVQTRNIVCATGAAAHPALPDWAGQLAVAGAKIHSSDYLYPRQLPAGDVLVIGGGVSGVQIARELSASHAVTLSVQTAEADRGARARAATFRRAHRRGGVPAAEYDRLRRDGVTFAAAAIGCEGSHVVLADGAISAPHSVVFATGFDAGDEWLPNGVASSSRRSPTTQVPGLYVAGIPRYSRPGADTIAGVWKDASAIAQHIASRP